MQKSALAVLSIKIKVWYWFSQDIKRGKGKEASDWRFNKDWENQKKASLPLNLRNKRALIVAQLLCREDTADEHQDQGHQWGYEESGKRKQNLCL